MWSKLSDGIKNCIYKGILPSLTIYLTVSKTNEDGGIDVVTLVSGEDFVLGGQSATRKFGAQGENGTPVGACDIGSFDFEILNAGNWQYSFTDGTFDATLTYTWTENDTETSETINWGKYLVVGHEYADAGRTIMVHGYDYMAKLDQENIDIMAEFSGASVIYGGQILKKVIEGYTLNSDYYGRGWLSASQNPLLGNDTVVWQQTYSRHGQSMDWPDIPVMTKRQALMYLLQIKGLYAYFDNDGLLCIRDASPTDKFSGSHTLLKTSAGSTPSNTNFPYFSVDVSPSMLSGARFTNSLISEEAEIYGDLSGVFFDISNPFFLDSSEGASYGNVPMSGTFGFHYIFTRYYMSGNINALAFPLSPGALIENNGRNRWNNMIAIGGSGFLVTSAVWRDGASAINLSCDCERIEYADIRREPTQEEVVPDIFQSGTAKLNFAHSGTGWYYASVQVLRVPARYLNSYVIIATPTSGGTIKQINRGTTFIQIFGDTQGMEVSYQLCKPTVSSNSNSVTTNYGALAAQHISDLEASYTS